jgi:phospholipid transport system substrate-binding protein
MTKRFFLPALATLALFFLFCPVARAGAPQDRVHAMLDKVMAIQTNPALQGETHRDQRRAEIQKVIVNNFNFQTMARTALGAQWGKLDAKQQTEFKDIFQDLFGDSYTRLVLNFLHREKIAYHSEKTHGKQAEVKTTIYRSDEEIPVDYLLESSSKGWLVTDVKIDGVSIVGNYRRTFARIIERQSYHSLLEKMRLQQRALKEKS